MSRKRVRRIAVVIVAVCLSFITYPVGGGIDINGVPLPVIIIEPSADGKSMLPFTSPLSLVFMLINPLILAAVAIAIENRLFPPAPSADG